MASVQLTLTQGSDIDNPDTGRIAVYADSATGELYIRDHSGNTSKVGERQGWFNPCRVYTNTLPTYTRTGNTLTANSNGVLGDVSSISLSINDSILLDATNPQDSGIYTVTNLGAVGSPWVLNRRPDLSTTAQAVNGIVMVQEGDVIELFTIKFSDNYVINQGSVTLEIYNLSGTSDAGGDLSGTYPNPTVEAARGLKTATSTVSISNSAAPTVGQILTAIDSDSAQWSDPVGGGGSVPTLTVDTNWYVNNTTGDDANDGSAGTPWATFDKAWSERQKYGVVNATLRIYLNGTTQYTANTLQDSVCGPNGYILFIGTAETTAATGTFTSNVTATSTTRTATTDNASATNYATKWMKLTSGTFTGRRMHIRETSANQMSFIHLPTSNTITGSTYTIYDPATPLRINNVVNNLKGSDALNNRNPRHIFVNLNISGGISGTCQFSRSDIGYCGCIVGQCGYILSYVQSFITAPASVFGDAVEGVWLQAHNRMGSFGGRLFYGFLAGTCNGYAGSRSLSHVGFSGIINGAISLAVNSYFEIGSDGGFSTLSSTINVYDNSTLTIVGASAFSGASTNITLNRGSKLVVTATSSTLTGGVTGGGTSSGPYWLQAYEGSYIVVVNGSLPGLTGWMRLGDNVITLPSNPLGFTDYLVSKTPTISGITGLQAALDTKLDDSDASTTPTANLIPKADGSGFIDAGWLDSVEPSSDLAEVIQPYLGYAGVVVSASITTPPPSPTEGAQYLIPTGATGVWSPYVNHIALWSNGVWIYVPPFEGKRVGVVDNNIELKYVSGTWTSPSGSYLPQTVAIGNSYLNCWPNSTGVAPGGAANTGICNYGSGLRLVQSGVEALVATTAQISIPSQNLRIGSGTLPSGVSLGMPARTDSIQIAAGTTAQRPATGAQAMFRMNITAIPHYPEYWNGSIWQRTETTELKYQFLSTEINTTKHILIARPVAIPVGLTGSATWTPTAPSATTNFDIQRNGTSIGTISFAASSQIATYTFTTLTNAVNGDRTTVISPANLNGMGDVYINLVGYLV